MIDTTHFTIGATATVSDGTCGEVTRVVIDPVARQVTHLVIEPAHRRGLGRLVPLDLVERADDTVVLRGTLASFDALDHAEETQFLTGVDGHTPYVPGATLYWPYYVLAIDGDLEPVVDDVVPFGELAMRRGDPVHATDGDIGKVEGVVMDAESRRLTHVLLQEGHLFSRKHVAIPIGAIDRVEDRIQLHLTKQQVQDLPPVEAVHPAA